MNCDEQLYGDGDDYSYRDCQLKLGHEGAHEYFGQKFARPVPSGELDPKVADLIQKAAEKRGAWGLDERQWPIVVEVTNVYIIKAPGETEDEALKFWGDGDYPDLDGEQAIDGSFDVRRADKYELSANQPCSPFGPLIACPDCGKQAMQREWLHNPLRKCHGPIKWRESKAPSLTWRYSREITFTPAYGAVS
jgi:hypothetical protein